MAIVMCLTAVLACGASADVVSFGDFVAPNLNLLECWNSDGTYGLTLTASCVYVRDGVPEWEQRLSFDNGMWCHTNYNMDGDVIGGPSQTGGNEMSIGGVNLNRVMNYFSWSNAARFGHDNTVGVDYVISITYSFDSDVTIGALASFWQQDKHTASNYTWLDGSGNVLATVPQPVDPFDPVNFVRLTPGVHVDVLQTPVTTNKVTFQMVLDGRSDHNAVQVPRLDDDGNHMQDEDENFLYEYLPLPPNAYHVAALGGLAAYLAPGLTPDMSRGNYNIFYVEKAAPTLRWANPEKEGQPGGQVEAGRWTDHVMGDNGGKPYHEAANATWEFSQAYELVGMILPQYDSGRYLADAVLEALNEDGEWVIIWQPIDYGYPNNNYYDYGQGYITFHESVLASAVRLSWGENHNAVEITEFQLFGKSIPEPMTLTLLTLGGAALLRRKR